MGFVTSFVAPSTLSHFHESPAPAVDFMKNVCKMSEPQKIVQLDKCWKLEKCKSQVSIEQARARRRLLNDRLPKWNII